MIEFFIILLFALDGGNIVVLVSAILGAGGLVGGIIALLKFKPEAGQILVTTAQGVVLVQTSVIDSLQKEVARIGKGYDECRQREQKLQDRVAELERINERNKL